MTLMMNHHLKMLYTKFAKSIAEKFLIPYNEKLYACDLDDLDEDAMGRFFPYANKEEIIKNFKKLIIFHIILILLIQEEVQLNM